MTWSKAVAKIEAALADGANVAITYHRKWMKNDRHINDVINITEYEWEGKVCKAIHTSINLVDEGTWIIDEVLTDYFFGTKFD